MLGARWQLLAWLIGHGDPPGLDRVLALPVAAPRRDEVPAIRFDRLDYLADLQWHDGSPVTSELAKRINVRPKLGRRNPYIRLSRREPERLSLPTIVVDGR